MQNFLTDNRMGIMIRHIILFLIGFSSLCSCTKAPVEPEEPAAPVIQDTENLIANWNMEQDVDMGTVSLPVNGNWGYIGGWNENAATPVHMDNRGINGSRCLVLMAADEEVDVGFAQTVTVKPGTPYKAMARIKTEGVTGGAGGHLSLDYLWAPRSESVMNTSDWTNVVLEFEPETDKVTLCLKLGNTAASSKGVAYFDNVTLKVNTDLYILESEHIRLVINKKYLAVSEDVVKTWLSRLDMVYDAYKELFNGRTPFDGEKMTIRSAVIDAWAYAGNPIQWNQDYIEDALLQVKNGDWCFGILHEIGHNYAPYMSDASYTWNFNEELFANFRMYYALCKLNGTIITDASVPNGDGTYSNVKKTYTGKEIAALYKSDTDNCYDRTIGANRAVEMGNALCWCFCRMVDKYGWDMWIDTFDELYTIPRNEAEEKSMNHWERFEYLMKYLNKHAPEDVHNSFTEAELRVIKTYLETQK